MGPNPAAAAAPAPPDDPPGDASGCQGFHVRPCNGFAVVTRIESSGVLVRPTMIAPARRRLRTSGESPGAIRLANAGTPFVVACPSTSIFTLIVTGTPNSGPGAARSFNARSAAAASARA